MAPGYYVRCPDVLRRRPDQAGKPSDNHTTLIFFTTSFACTVSAPGWIPPFPQVSPPVVSLGRLCHACVTRMVNIAVSDRSTFASAVRRQSSG